VTDTTRRLTNTGGWAVSGDYTEGSTLSPDAGSVAYHWWNTREQRTELKVISLAGHASPRVVLSWADYVRPLAWTPDGRIIVHRQSLGRINHLGVVSVRDGAYRGLVGLEERSPRRASLSPDGRHLAYAVPAGANGSPRDIFVLDLHDGRQITAVGGATDDYDPIWSPDGARLLFLSTRTGAPSLWAIDVKDGQPASAPVVIKPDLGSAALLGITRSRALFYLLSGRDQSDVLVAPFDGGVVTKPAAPATDTFVSRNQGPAWSPDGESLAFVSLRDRPVLVIRTIKTGVEHEVGLPLSLAPLFRAAPRWFPDGRSVLVLSRQNADYVFLRVFVDTGRTEPLHTIQTLLSSFTLSPDGRTIFWAVQQGQLMKYDLVERRETALASGEWFITVAISPDGRHLAYVRSTTPPNSMAIIEVMPVSGGPAREIHRDPNSGGSRYNTLAWSPDSASVIFVDETNRLWRLPLNGVLSVLPGTLGRGRVKAPAIHPSGSMLAFGLSQDGNNEIWRLEHVLPAR
jgi:Tol biopolymer transport system component